MEGKRRNGKDMQDSLVVEEGLIFKFLLVPFVTCLLPLQLLQHHELCGTRSSVTHHPALFARTEQSLWQELLKKFQRV